MWNILKTGPTSCFTLRGCISRPMYNLWWYTVEPRMSNVVCLKNQIDNRFVGKWKQYSPEDRPILTRPYPDLCTRKEVQSGVINVSPRTLEVLRHLPTCNQPPRLCPAHLQSSTSNPIQPTIAWLTASMQNLRLTCLLSMRSSSIIIITRRHLLQLNNNSTHAHL